MSRQPAEDPKKRAADNFNRRLRNYMILVWTGRVLMLIGVLIAAQHLLAHAGYRPIGLSMGAQDLLVGYPTAALVALVGLFIWGRNPVR